MPALWVPRSLFSGICPLWSLSRAVIRAKYVDCVYDIANSFQNAIPCVSPCGQERSFLLLKKHFRGFFFNSLNAISTR